MIELPLDLPFPRSRCVYFTPWLRAEYDNDRHCYFGRPVESPHYRFAEAWVCIDKLVEHYPATFENVRLITGEVGFRLIALHPQDADHRWELVQVDDHDHDEEQEATFTTLPDYTRSHPLCYVFSKWLEQVLAHDNRYLVCELIDLNTGRPYPIKETD